MRKAGNILLSVLPPTPLGILENQEGEKENHGSENIGNYWVNLIDQVRRNHFAKLFLYLKRKFRRKSLHVLKKSYLTVLQRYLVWNKNPNKFPTDCTYLWSQKCHVHDKTYHLNSNSKFRNKWYTCVDCSFLFWKLATIFS